MNNFPSADFCMKSRNNLLKKQLQTAQQVFPSPGIIVQVRSDG